MPLLCEIADAAVTLHDMGECEIVCQCGNRGSQSSAPIRRPIQRRRLDCPFHKRVETYLWNPNSKWHLSDPRPFRVRSGKRWRWGNVPLTWPYPSPVETIQLFIEQCQSENYKNAGSGDQAVRSKTKYPGGKRYLTNTISVCSFSHSPDRRSR